MAIPTLYQDVLGARYSPCAIYKLLVRAWQGVFYPYPWGFLLSRIPSVSKRVERHIVLTNIPYIILFWIYRK